MCVKHQKEKLLTHQYEFMLEILLKLEMRIPIYGKEKERERECKPYRTLISRVRGLPFEDIIIFKKGSLFG